MSLVGFKAKNHPQQRTEATVDELCPKDGAA